MKISELYQSYVDKFITLLVQYKEYKDIKEFNNLINSFNLAVSIAEIIVYLKKNGLNSQVKDFKARLKKVVLNDDIYKYLNSRVNREVRLLLDDDKFEELRESVNDSYHSIIFILQLNKYKYYSNKPGLVSVLPSIISDLI